MRWILLAAAAASLVIYARAIRNLFSREYGVDRRMTLLQVGGLIAAAVHLISIGFYPVSVGRGLMASAIYATGLFVFYSARAAANGHRLTLAFSNDTPSGLVLVGIYARVRHPFYLAYSLTWIGGTIAVPSWETIVAATIMIATYVHAARFEETKFRDSSLAEEYAAYCSRAGFFWPKI